MYKFTERHKKNLRKAHLKYLDSIGNSLGRIRYKNKTGLIVKVKSEDYPECKNYDSSIGRSDSRFKWILHSYKVWIDCGNKCPNVNEVLFHLDGNNKNNDITNLKLIPRSLLGPLCKKHRILKDKQINTSNIILTLLEKEIKKLIKKNKRS